MITPTQRPALNMPAMASQLLNVKLNANKMRNKFVIFFIDSMLIDLIRKKMIEH